MCFPQKQRIYCHCHSISGYVRAYWSIQETHQLSTILALLFSSPATATPPPSTSYSKRIAKHKSFCWWRWVQFIFRTDCPDGLAWSGTHLGIYWMTGVSIMLAGCSGKTRRKSSYGLPCVWERENIMKIERNGKYVL